MSETETEKRRNGETEMGESSLAVSPFLRFPVPLSMCGAVVRWCDPEWPTFMIVMLLPALLFVAFADWQRASFFAGTAIYVGTLKWLGWAVLTRFSTRLPTFVLYPAEIFAGLAVACLWFYVRNLLAMLAPALYGLVELSIVAYLIVGVHAAYVLAKARAFVTVGRIANPSYDRRSVATGLLMRAAVYLPYCVALTVALWFISGTIYVQSYDAIHHAFSARVYVNDGLSLAHFNGGRPILYTSGFGAINAVCVAMSPLTVVQAVNLQHVFLLVTGVFLVPGAVASLVERPLWLLHWLVLPVVGLFPLYNLDPYVDYAGAPRQAAPALFLALCLLPLLVPLPRSIQMSLLVAIETMLGLIAVTLNPACAPFVAVLLPLTFGITFYRAKRQMAQRLMHSFAVAGGVVLLLSALVLSCDQYYSAWATDPERTADPAQDLEKKPLRFSTTSGLAAAARTNPIAFHDPFLTGGPEGPLRTGSLWATLLMACTLLAAMIMRRRTAVPPACRPLAGIVLACLALWLVMKYSMIFLAQGLPLDSWDTALLGNYVGFLLGRSEVVLVLIALIAGGSGIALTVEAVGGRRALAGFVGLVAIAFILGTLPFVHALPESKSSPVVLDRELEQFGGPGGFRITKHDVELVAWMNQHIPPDKGLVGLACWTFPFGKEGDKREKHMCPAAGAQAVLFYGEHYNFCFAQLDPSRPYGFDDYNTHVKDSFDADWCLRNGIRYFYLPQVNLEGNPGLAKAVERGSLRLVKHSGASGIYEVRQ